MTHSSSTHPARTTNPTISHFPPPQLEFVLANAAALRAALRGEGFYFIPPVSAELPYGVIYPLGGTDPTSAPPLEKFIKNF